MGWPEAVWLGERLELELELGVADSDGLADAELLTEGVLEPEAVRRCEGDPVIVRDCDRVPVRETEDERVPVCEGEGVPACEGVRDRLAVADEDAVRVTERDCVDEGDRVVACVRDRVPDALGVGATDPVVEGVCVVVRVGVWLGDVVWLPVAEDVAVTDCVAEPLDDGVALTDRVPVVLMEGDELCVVDWDPDPDCVPVGEGERELDGDVVDDAVELRLAVSDDVELWVDDADSVGEADPLSVPDTDAVSDCERLPDELGVLDKDFVIEGDSELVCEGLSSADPLLVTLWLAVPLIDELCDLVELREGLCVCVAVRAGEAVPVPDRVPVLLGVRVCELDREPV